MKIRFLYVFLSLFFLGSLNPVLADGQWRFEASNEVWVVSAEVEGKLVVVGETSGRILLLGKRKAREKESVAVQRIKDEVSRLFLDRWDRFENAVHVLPKKPLTELDRFLRRMFGEYPIQMDITELAPRFRQILQLFSMPGPNDRTFALLMTECPEMDRRYVSPEEYSDKLSKYYRRAGRAPQPFDLIDFLITPETGQTTHLVATYVWGDLVAIKLGSSVDAGAEEAPYIVLSRNELKDRIRGLPEFMGRKIRIEQRTFSLRPQPAKVIEPRSVLQTFESEPIDTESILRRRLAFYESWLRSFFDQSSEAFIENRLSSISTARISSVISQGLANDNRKTRSSALELESLFLQYKFLQDAFVGSKTLSEGWTIDKWSFGETQLEMEAGLAAKGKAGVEITATAIWGTIVTIPAYVRDVGAEIFPKSFAGSDPQAEVSLDQTVDVIRLLNEKVKYMEKLPLFREQASAEIAARIVLARRVAAQIDESKDVDPADLRTQFAARGISLSPDLENKLLQRPQTISVKEWKTIWQKLFDPLQICDAAATQVQMRLRDQDVYPNLGGKTFEEARNLEDENHRTVEEHLEDYLKKAFRRRPWPYVNRERLHQLTHRDVVEELTEDVCQSLELKRSPGLTGFVENTLERLVRSHQETKLTRSPADVPDVASIDLGGRTYNQLADAEAQRIWQLVRWSVRSEWLNFLLSLQTERGGEVLADWVQRLSLAVNLRDRPLSEGVFLDKNGRSFDQMALSVLALEIQELQMDDIRPLDLTIFLGMTFEYNGAPEEGSPKGIVIATDHPNKPENEEELRARFELFEKYKSSALKVLMYGAELHGVRNGIFSNLVNALGVNFRSTLGSEDPLWRSLYALAQRVASAVPRADDAVTTIGGMFASDIARFEALRTPEAVTVGNQVQRQHYLVPMLLQAHVTAMNENSPSVPVEKYIDDVTIRRFYLALLRGVEEVLELQKHYELRSEDKVRQLRTSLADAVITLEVELVKLKRQPENSTAVRKATAELLAQTRDGIYENPKEARIGVGKNIDLFMDGPRFFNVVERITAEHPEFSQRYASTANLPQDAAADLMVIEATTLNLNQRLRFCNHLVSQGDMRVADGASLQSSVGSSFTISQQVVDFLNMDLLSRAEHVRQRAAAERLEMEKVIKVRMPTRERGFYLPKLLKKVINGGSPKDAANSKPFRRVLVQTFKEAPMPGMVFYGAEEHLPGTATKTAAQDFRERILNASYQRAALIVTLGEAEYGLLILRPCSMEYGKWFVSDMKIPPSDAEGILHFQEDKIVPVLDDFSRLSLKPDRFEVESVRNFPNFLDAASAAVAEVSHALGEGVRSTGFYFPLGNGDAALLQFDPAREAVEVRFVPGHEKVMEPGLLSGLRVIRERLTKLNMSTARQDAQIFQAMMLDVSHVPALDPFGPIRDAHRIRRATSALRLLLKEDSESIFSTDLECDAAENVLREIREKRLSEPMVLSETSRVALEQLCYRLGLEIVEGSEAVEFFKHPYRVLTGLLVLSEFYVHLGNRDAGIPSEMPARLRSYLPSAYQRLLMYDGEGRLTPKMLKRFFRVRPIPKR